VPRSIDQAESELIKQSSTGAVPSSQASNKVSKMWFQPITGRQRGPLKESRGIGLLFSLNLGTLDGGGWSTPRPGRLYPGKGPVPILLESEWASGFDPRTFQPVATSQ
jgi:hypothetical protein